MTKTSASRSHLASLIEGDMRKRGLRAGDRYLTAQEVAGVLGVSAMTANRAMQELARREVLQRSRKSGTFVGARFKSETPSALKCVHLLMPPEYLEEEQVLVDSVVSGVHAELPEVAIQLTFVPASAEIAFVRRLVEDARKSGTLGGFVLFLSSPALQRFVRESGVPAVVAGSVHPGTGELPWFDRDQKQIGRLLARAALERGRRRIAVIMRDRWGAGDNLLIDGIQEELGSARTRPDRLLVRSFPADPVFIAAALRELLRSDSRPTALICRSRLAADAAAEAARGLGIRDLAVYLSHHYANDRRPVPYPHTDTIITAEEHGRSIARMLRKSTGPHLAEVVFRPAVTS